MVTLGAVGVLSAGRDTDEVVEAGPRCRSGQVPAGLGRSVAVGVAATETAQRDRAQDPGGERAGDDRPRGEADRRSRRSRARWWPVPLVVEGAVTCGAGTVVGGTVDGVVVVEEGAGAVVGGEGGMVVPESGAEAGVATAGRTRVQPGSIQWGSVSVAPSGWGRPSLSW